MSLATLRAVEQQLSLAVDAAQRHLQVASVLDTSVASSHEIDERFQSLATSIELLQTELQSKLSNILTQTRDRQLLVPSEAPNASVQDPIVLDEETESEDDTKHLPELKSAQEKPQNKRERVVTKEKMATALQRFVQTTGGAAAAVGSTKGRCKIGQALGACRVVVLNVVALLQQRQIVEEVSACLFRDSLVKLAEIVSDRRIGGRVSGNMLVQVLPQLDLMLTLANEVEGAPTMLSGEEMRGAQQKIKKYAQDHADDKLLQMHTFVESMQKKRLSGDSVEGPIRQLSMDLNQEMSNYKCYHDIGLPPRSEERWKMFAEVAKTLGVWIGRMAMTAKPPKTLRLMARSARNFDSKFSGRVPSLLLKNAQMRIRFSRQLDRAENKAKNQKGK